MPVLGLRSIRRYKKEAIVSSQSIEAERVGAVWRPLPRGGAVEVVENTSP
jgi:hypothetical protein